MMTTDLPTAELEWYRESRGIDAGSPEWDHLLAWYRESHPLLDCALMDEVLARFRGDGG
jgi:hypothetical protein